MFQKNQQIGLYTLIEKLGKGGFGEVWLAEKRSQFVTKKVAVKLPLDEQVNFDAIRQEATLWEQASGHANVLPIIDADIYNGQVLIVSEYADGGSLADKLKNEGNLSIKQAVETTIGILSGLQYLHNKHIIHRDIKPQNILLQEDTPRLADFGISRAVQTNAVSSTIVGTDAYMSPETFEGNRSIQTDIWSVGVVLYQLLTGNLPFPQDHPTERMFAILMKDFVPLPEDIPSDLQKIIKKALAKNPNERFQTASEMRDDLKDYLYTISSPVKASNQSSIIPVTQPAIQQNFPLPPKNERDIVAETSETKLRTLPQQAETLIFNAKNTQSDIKKSKNPFLKFAAIAAVAVLLVGGILTAGYFAYQKIASSYLLAGSFKNISAQDMELIFEDSSPETLKSLAENPDRKKEMANSLKEILAIAAEAHAQGFSQKSAVKGQLDFIEKQVIALAYDQRKAGNNALPPLSSISDADAKAFLDKQGNEQRFKEFFEITKEANVTLKDRQFSDSEVADFKQQWAKIQVGYERAMSERSNLSERELRKIELQVKLQQTHFLAAQYSQEVLTPKLAATTEEIEDYKKKHPEYDTKSKKAKAEEILQKAKNGEDFDKLAKEFSEDPGSKDKGGLYENVLQGQMVPEFEQAALALEPGQVAPNPVESKFGYHIIKLIRKGTTKDATGKDSVTYDVRHILISTTFTDPNNPLNQQMPANDKIRAQLEEEKRKKLLEELIAKHKITVAEDFKVPQNSK